jgi:diguanylate cyclase (GGDEF)-like protein
LSTNELPKNGERRVVIQEISISCPYVSDIAFQKFMLFTWLGIGVLLGISQVVGLHKKLTRSKTEQLSLQRQTDELAELAQMANVDPLTQILNRRGMRDHVSCVMRELEQFGQPFSLIMFDIDNFKMINDKNGHARGDEILELVAFAVSDSLGDKEIVARWGGEEFLVLCRDSTLKDSTQLAQELRLRIEQDVDITCSFGVYEATAGQEFHEMLEYADKCLYQAKQTGKNRVVSCQSHSATNGSKFAGDTIETMKF